MKNFVKQKLKNKINILITNPGRRVYFIEFLKKIKLPSIKINIFCADNNQFAPSININAKSLHKIVIPKVVSGRKKYLKKILEIVKKKKIDLIIPLTDYDLAILSKNIQLIKKFNECDVLLANSRFVKICMNKILFEKFCKKNNFLSPKIYKKNELVNLKYPVIIKPIYGSASKNISIVKSKKDLNKTKLNGKIIQKYISGNEYHIDILNDFEGNFLSCCVKKKLSMWNGETDKAEIKRDLKLEKLSKKISSASKHLGNLDCDLIADNNKNFYLIDFNPRFGGGYPFTHLSGMNYLDAIIRNKLKMKYSHFKNSKKRIFTKGISIHEYK